MHLIDRTRIETDWYCQQARFWRTEYRDAERGVRFGIVPAGTAVELQFGIAMHHAFERLLAGDHHGPIVTELREALSTLPVETEIELLELQALGEGLFWGWARRVWPVLAGTYEVKGVECEIDIPLDVEVTIMTRPDAVLMDRTDLSWWNYDFKTIASPNVEVFNAHFQDAIQIHLNALACEQHFNQPFAGSIVQGLSKGFKRDRSIHSPFTYIYVKGEAKSATYMPKWERVPTWKLDGGVEEVVKWLSDDIIWKQFPRTDPILIDRERLEHFMRQQHIREREIHDFHMNLRTREETFQRAHSNCTPMIGRQCAYHAACWNPAVAVNPLALDKYKPREPHHARERRSE